MKRLLLLLPFLIIRSTVNYGDSRDSRYYNTMKEIMDFKDFVRKLKDPSISEKKYKDIKDKADEKEKYLTAIFNSSDYKNTTIEQDYPICHFLVLGYFRLADSQYKESLGREFCSDTLLLRDCIVYKYKKNVTKIEYAFITRTLNDMFTTDKKEFETLSDKFKISNDSVISLFNNLNTRINYLKWVCNKEKGSTNDDNLKVDSLMEKIEKTKSTPELKEKPVKNMKGSLEIHPYKMIASKIFRAFLTRKKSIKLRENQDSQVVAKIVSGKNNSFVYGELPYDLKDTVDTWDEVLDIPLTEPLQKNDPPTIQLFYQGDLIDQEPFQPAINTIP